MNLFSCEECRWSFVMPLIFFLHTHTHTDRQTHTHTQRNYYTQTMRVSWQEDHKKRDHKADRDGAQRAALYTIRTAALTNKELFILLHTTSTTCSSYHYKSPSLTIDPRPRRSVNHAGCYGVQLRRIPPPSSIPNRRRRRHRKRSRSLETEQRQRSVP